MNPKKINNFAPSVKVLALDNGMSSDAAAREIFSWLGKKLHKDKMPSPDDVEACLRLVPVKLEFRNILKSVINSFLDANEVIECAITGNSIIMLPFGPDDDKKLIQIWKDTLGSIFTGIDKLADISSEAADEMERHFLSTLLTANADITVTAWDLRYYILDEIEAYEPDFAIDDEVYDPDPPALAIMLLQKLQQVWPWLVEDIHIDPEYTGETVH